MTWRVDILGAIIAETTDVAGKVSTWSSEKEASDSKSSWVLEEEEETEGVGETSRLEWGNTRSRKGSRKFLEETKV